MWLDETVVGAWTDLARRLDDAETLPRWAVDEPALAGLPGVSALPGLLSRGADLDRCDALLGALVRVAATDPDAVLVVVHLLGDGIAAVVARLRDLSTDITAVFVGALVVQIRTFPHATRSRAYAKSLLLDARAQVLRELGLGRGRGSGHRGRELAVDPFELHAVTSSARPGEDDGDDPVTQVADLREWAARHGVATTADVDLLLDLHRVRHSGRGHGGRHMVAARYGVNERTVRRRRDAALASLRAAAPEYLAALA